MSQTKLWTYLDIVHEKCTETIWAHVTCSFVWTVTNGRHDVHTLESSTNSIVDTTGFTPVRLERDPGERERMSSERTRRRKYRSLWWRTNFFVRFLRIFPLTRGRSFVDVAAIVRTNDDLKRMPMQVMTFFSVHGRKIALDWSSARSRFYSSRRCDFVISRIFSYKNKSTKITRLFFDIHSFSLLLTGTGTGTARTIVGWATSTVSATLDKHKSIKLLSGSNSDRHLRILVEMIRHRHRLVCHNHRHGGILVDLAQMATMGEPYQLNTNGENVTTSAELRANFSSTSFRSFGSFRPCWSFECCRNNLRW